MFSTPDYNHVYLYKDVYEPSEDSFLLLDALESEADFLLGLKPSLCLEVGSGSGVVITFLASILGNDLHYLATDINPNACICTQETARKNGVPISVVNTNMCDGLRFPAGRQVDILLFNPPYVVTPSHEVSDNGISAAWAGGNNGREVMDKLFPIVPKILSEKGVFYLLVLEENKPAEICNIMALFGFETKTVLKRKARNEHLLILRIHRP
ncbi:methyltransferase N6AMT1-like [Dendronephthya gigantea]|uniref:methyltransferase N6AMT1-like n=1 Tax=Dendronephthya gigantea TaxID=151771 RepID=UPI001069A805|nr:methyltransferase N6AMT1-like [Dendronephthya gigantea]